MAARFASKVKIGDGDLIAFSGPFLVVRAAASSFAVWCMGLKLHALCFSAEGSVCFGGIQNLFLEKQTSNSYGSV